MDICKSFDKLMSHVFIKYAGVLIEKTCEGFIVFRQRYNSLDEAKKAVDEAYKTLGNTVRK